MRTLLVICLSLAVLAPGARAQSLTGNDLSQCLDETAPKATSEECIAYIMGVTEGLAVGAMRGEEGDFYCVPEDGTGGQFASVVENFMAENPDRLGESALAVIMFALDEAYGCDQPE